MNRTENYQLPQWVREDRILMDDFNEAMGNIDKGIHEAKTAAENVGTRLDQNTLLVRLGTVAVQVNTTTKKAIPNISDYSMIFAFSNVKGTSSGVGVGLANNAGETSGTNVSLDFSSNGSIQAIFWMFPADTGICTIGLGGGSANLNASSLSAMKWNSATSLTTFGTRCTGTVTFYGLKA